MDLEQKQNLDIELNFDSFATCNGSFQTLERHQNYYLYETESNILNLQFTRRSENWGKVTLLRQVI